MSILNRIGISSDPAVVPNDRLMAWYLAIASTYYMASERPLLIGWWALALLVCLIMEAFSGHGLLGLPISIVGSVLIVRTGIWWIESNYFE